MVELLFMSLPLSSLVLYFIKDKKEPRGKVINIVILTNTLVFLFPLIYAFVLTKPDGNMWNENGPGAILWLYLILFPLCLIIQVVLLILKIIYRRVQE